MPELSDHIKQKLPAYLLAKYDNHQTYNEEGDGPPPAYGAPQDAAPSYYGDRIIRKIDWCKLTSLFSTVKDQESENISMLISKDALPGFGRSIEFYDYVFNGADTKSTIFGNIDVSLLLPEEAHSIRININSARNNINMNNVNRLDFFLNSTL